jgi:hypothetical protein
MGTQDKFVASINQIIGGINLCSRHQLMLPTLTLIYSTIDIMAYLNLLPLQESTQRKDFITWVDTYLLQGSSLICNSTDLYSARCGILHSLTAESDMSRSKKARMLFYSWGRANPAQMQQDIDIQYKGLTPSERPIVIKIDELFKSLKYGITKFEEEIHANRIKWLHVMTKADNFFTEIPKLGVQPDAAAGSA